MSARPNARGLGRIAHHDPRNADFRIRAVAPPLHVATAGVTRRYWNDLGLWVDQGDTPVCTAAAVLHWREDGPVTTPGPAALSLDAMYQRIRATDRADGRDYPEGGATSLALAKTAVALGWAGSYHWGYTLDELVQAVLTMGPVIVGTNWTESMFTPDDGVLHYTGAVVGGHEWIVNGVNLPAERFRMKNSWSREWSLSGRAWVPFADMARLIADDGDVLVLRERPADGRRVDAPA